jgi:hypothetical protein
MVGCAHAGPGVEVVPRAEVAFQPLNPARGAASPQAGVLWGDIKQDVPSGALIRFADGFSSPPHIHNITYRAVVISGAVHNDDPGAERLWMGPGSFWTQPAGEAHITAAQPGLAATAFLEILEGPYLVRPPDEAFDNGERPLNMEARNLVWLDEADVQWIDASKDNAGGASIRIAFLWGSLGRDQRNGTLLSLPQGSSGRLRGRGPWLRAVVIRGGLAHQRSGSLAPVPLGPGSYLGAKDGGDLDVTCLPGNDCLIYVSTQGTYDFAPAAPAPQAREDALDLKVVEVDDDGP